MLYTDCSGGMTDAVARHVSFAKITYQVGEAMKVVS